MGGWRRTDDLGTRITHIRPIDDLREHGDSDCWCEPRLETPEDYPVDWEMWVHNSMDGREVHERGKALN